MRTRTERRRLPPRLRTHSHSFMNPFQEELEKAKGKKAGEQDKESAFNVRSLLGEKKTDPSEELNKKLLKAARDGLVTLQNRFVKNWRQTC